jgi:hypothetical protein
VPLAQRFRHLHHRVLADGPHLAARHFCGRFPFVDLE